MTVGDFQSQIKEYSGVKLSDQELNNIWETCKVNVVYEPTIQERIIDIKDLVSHKLQQKTKRIEQLIQL